MKHDMQEPIPNPLLTRRACLLAMGAAPGMVGVGLMGRTALAADHELAFLREMTPATWAALYRESLDISAFREAYGNPSRDNTVAAAMAMNGQGEEGEVIDRDEEHALIALINRLFESRYDSLEGLRDHVGDIVGGINQVVDSVKDAVGVIVLGALDGARDFYERVGLDGIRELVVRQVIAAMEAVVTMGSLLRSSGFNPANYPRLLIAGAFLYAASEAWAASHELIFGD